MDRLEAMRTLIAAVDGGSLSAASRSLNVPLATVSRRVSELEALLRSHLVVRTSRKLLLTEAGAAYVGSARRLLDDLAEAERAASGEYRTPRGEMVVAAPVMFGKLNVAPIIHDFLAAYPDVTVRLILSDGLVDLVEAHADVAVRIGQLPDSALVTRVVGEVQRILCASPDYLTRKGTPATPEELASHECIPLERHQRFREWSFATPSGMRDYPINPRYSVNTADAVVAAATAGLGIARVLTYQAESGVGAGTLVPLLSEWAPPPIPVQVVHATHQQQPLKLRAFLDFVVPRLHERLRQIAARYAGVASPDKSFPHAAVGNGSM
jgi:DNA-binding transcriptional LysR family regulator